MASDCNERGKREGRSLCIVGVVAHTLVGGMSAAGLFPFSVLCYFVSSRLREGVSARSYVACSR